MNDNNLFSAALNLLSEAEDLRLDRYPFVTKNEQEVSERRLAAVLNRFKRLPLETQRAANRHVSEEALDA